jgi:aspartyl-tRNA(Asn)/glutamyl-tRNA(Gln) amidotransferase subunit B
MSELDYKVLVGLEIHVHLKTRTKMFCGCSLEYGDEPNTHVCPTCLGLPGSLPVMNKLAVEHAILAGMALSCETAKFTKWDRKGYYYPDLPKNYQISQYDMPLSGRGFIEIEDADGKAKRIRIIRAHLEEDAGKNKHTAGNYSQVDLNRAGSPLLEIVTEPDLSTGSEVRSLGIELQRIVRYLGISEGDMQKGHMRFEPNINLVINRGGVEYRTPIVEVKNLNSFKALERSVEYEVVRQLDDFEQTGKTIEMGNKSTRGWDDVNQVTVLQREKEEAHDYRYFPDPDLLPVTVDEEWLGRIRKRMCELPLEKQTRYVTEYGLTDYDAGVLTAERETAEFFEAAVKAGGEVKRVCNLVCQVGLKLAHEAGIGIGGLGISAESVAELSKMIETGVVNASAGDRIMAEAAESGKGPGEIAKELNLLQQNDAGELESIVEAAMAENPQAVEDAASGGKKSGKARGFLLGQVMQRSKWSANPKVVSEILNKKLQGGS